MHPPGRMMSHCGHIVFACNMAAAMKGSLRLSKMLEVLHAPLMPQQSMHSTSSVQRDSILKYGTKCKALIISLGSDTRTGAQHF